MIFYCNKTDGRLNNFFDNKKIFTTGIICSPDEDIYKVELEETSELYSSYVGYLDYKENNVIFVFSNRLQLSCCFPYGLDAELAENKGRVVYLRVKSEENLGKAGALCY